MPEKIEETPLRRISREVGDPGLFPAEVHALYEAGKARKAQAALRSHVPKELNTARKRRQQQHLEDTYLWLEPLGKAPSMHTINGIGTMLYGRYKPNADGVYVATLWFVAVFLPVWPIAAYVVRAAEGNAWTFYAKAPLPPFARFWRLGFLAVMAAIGLAVAGQVYWSESHAALWVYNGFDVPVDVRVDGEQLRLAPRQLQRAGSYPLEPVPVSATPEGWVVPLEELEAPLDSAGADELLYNIGGRASLVRSWVVYGPGTPRDDVLLGTGPFLDVSSADYLLRDPPESKQVREGGSVIDQVIYDPEPEVPFAGVVLFTLGERGFEDAWRILSSQLAVVPTDNQALSIATDQLLLGDPTLVAVGELARRGRPDDVQAHRLYQNLLGASAAEPAIAEYRALAAEHADDPMYQYLAGRLLDDADPDGLAYFHRALELDPDYPQAHLALAYLHANAGRWDEAIEGYDRYAASGPEAFAQTLRSRVRLLQVRAQPGWLQAVEGLLDQATEQLGADFGVAGLRATMSARWGSSPIDSVLDELREEILSVDLPETYLEAAIPLTQVDVLVAAGDGERARAVLASLDAESDALTLAKGAFYLALQSGEAQDIRAALDAHQESLAMPGTGLATIAAAAARAVGHSSAQALSEAAHANPAPGVGSFTVVLAPDAELGSPRALDELLAEVPLDVRGAGYAAAAVLLEQSGESPAALAHARSRAARLLLADEGPCWR